MATRPRHGNARATAALMLDQLQRGRSLSLLLEEGLTGVASKDVALVKELCFGVARWWPQLDAVSHRLVSRPIKARDGDIRALILLGLYQLLHMRIAPHAALAETVEASKVLRKPWAAGLVNAVLRRFQRERASLLAEVERDPAVHYLYPDWLLKALMQAWPEHWEALVQASAVRPPMSLRVNLSRIGRDDYLQMLASAGILASPLRWVAGGVMLDRPVDVADLPGFAAGLVSVQDGGAQLAASLMDPGPGMRILDACAAPGGKSCHILESAPGQVILTALDIDARRLDRINANLKRLGLSADLCQGDASDPKGAWTNVVYDRILLDVPCSATGVIRRHPDIKLLRRPQDIPSLTGTQQRILEATWPLLKRGGRLLYTTCSLLPEENQRQIRGFLESHGDAREKALNAAWGHDCNPGRQTLPGEDEMDGFYYACLEKM